MSLIYESLIYLHVGVGFTSLILFWIPIFSRKGSFLHVKTGRLYVWAMYIVAISAAILASLIMLDPIATKYPTTSFSPDKLKSTIEQERLVSLFLLAISFLVLSNVRHGLLSLRAKRDHKLMRAPSHLLLNVLLLVSGVSLLVAARGGLQILFFIFAGLCIVSAIGNIRYCLKKQVAKNEWLIAHLGSMLGAGIGSYTAFFVFGGNRFLSEVFVGQLMLIPWTAPGIVGGITITYLSRHYRNRQQLSNKTLHN